MATLTHPFRSLAALALLLIFASSCSHGDASEGGRSGAVSDAPVCVIALDVDRSTSSVPGLHDRYRAWVQSISTMCATEDPEAFIEIFTVSSDTATSPIAPIVVDLAAERSRGGLQSNDLRDLAGQAALANSSCRAQTLFEQTSDYSGTDLFSVVRVVQPVFQTRPTSGRRLLVLMTDGLNARPPFDITVQPIGSPEHRQTLLSELAAQGLSNDLPEGVEVWMIGVGVGAGAEQLDAGRLNGIRSLWLEYFDGALLPERYDKNLPADVPLLEAPPCVGSDGETAP